jgi:hypothetical protein
MFVFCDLWPYLKKGTVIMPKLCKDVLRTTVENETAMPTGHSSKSDGQDIPRPPQKPKM